MPVVAYGNAVFQVQKQALGSHGLADAHFMLFVAQVYHKYAAYFIYQVIQPVGLAVFNGLFTDAGNGYRRFCSFLSGAAGAYHYLLQIFASWLQGNFQG